MKRVIFETISGLLMVILGFYLAFIYLYGMEEGSSPWLLFPSIFLIIIGLYLLIRAGKSEDTVVLKKDLDKPSNNVGKKEGLESIIQRNNELSAEWAKTIETRDRMKLLEISASAQKPGSNT
jgi:hypothetical protein